MSFCSKFATMAMALILLVLPLPAQPTTNCQDYNVIVNVRDEQGRFVPGLTASDLLAHVRKRPLPISSVQAESGPRRAIILLDISGSMTITGDPHSGNKWKAALNLARAIVESAPARDELALMTFSTEIIDTVGLSSSHAEIAQHIEGLSNAHTVTPKHKLQTSMLDAILQAAELLNPPSNGDAIYIVSDGEDNDSQARVKQVEDTLLALRIRTYLFEVPSFYRYSDLEASAEDSMLLARTTGGYNLLLRRNLGYTEQFDLGPAARAVIEKGVRYIHDQTTNFYRLGLDVRELVDKKREWSLEVVDSQGRKRKGIEVIYPHELLPCQGKAHP